MERGTSQEPVSLMGELRRRKVLYTAVVYGISAFAVTEIGAFLFENFGAPVWAERLLAALFVAGFPVAMFLAWAFDIGADGIVRASPEGRRRRWPTIALALGLLVVATGGLFYLIFPEPPAADMSEVSADQPGASSDSQDFEPVEKLENSIAVLPFENLSTDPDNAYFSSGVAEEVLNHLGGYRELNIIGRTSSFVFRDTDYPVPRIAALLGVRFLLQGSVRRHEDQVRVSTQLLDENGVQLWSRNFDRRLTDIFAIQSEIAVAVAEAVVPEVMARAPELHPTNLAAYDHYLKGRDLLYQRKVDEAVAALQQAVELDPQFASAHAELAIALAMFEQIEAARLAADTALDHQPGLLRALAARGLILQMQRPPDWPASAAILRQVVALEPNMVDALNWLSTALGQQGQGAESDELLNRAWRLDPLHPSISRNAVDRAARNGEDRRAITIARQVIENPQNQTFHPYVALFQLYRARGKLADAARVAREWTETAASVDLLDTECYCMLMWVHWDLGDGTLTDYWLNRSRRDFPESLFNAFFGYLALRWQGRYGDALDAANARLRDLYGQREAPQIEMLRLGVLEGLAGNHSSAIETLAPLLDTQAVSSLNEQLLEAFQTLAWAYIESGQPGRAEPLLSALEDEFEAFQQQGVLLFQLDDVPYGYALNAALRGEREQALERLETIIGSGWRSYYARHHDPRWGRLRDDPRFQELMAEVKADVDRQRNELESTKPHQAFVARLDAIMAAGGESAQ